MIPRPDCRHTNRPSPSLTAIAVVGLFVLAFASCSRPPGGKTASGGTGANETTAGTNGRPVPAANLSALIQADSARSGFYHDGAIRSNAKSDAAVDLPADPTSPALVLSDSFVVAESDFAIHRVSRQTGMDMWRLPIRAPEAGAMAIVDSRLYAPLSDGTMICADVANGQLLWRAEVGKGIPSAPVVGSRFVFTGDASGAVVALNPSSGKPAWSSAILSQSDNGGDQAGSGSASVASSGVGALDAPGLTLSDGSLYARLTSSDAKSYVVAISPDDGSTIWKTAIAASLSAQATIAEGALYVGSEDGSLFAFDRTTGKINWRSNTSGATVMGMSTDGNRLYVAMADRGIAAIRLTDGAMVWRRWLPTASASAPTILEDTVVAIDDSGDVSAFRATDGLWLWQLPGNVPVVGTLSVGADGTAVVTGASGPIRPISGSAAYATGIENDRRNLKFLIPGAPAIVSPVGANPARFVIAPVITGEYDIALPDQSGSESGGSAEATGPESGGGASGTGTGGNGSRIRMQIAVLDESGTRIASNLNELGLQSDVQLSLIANRQYTIEATPSAAASPDSVELFSIKATMLRAN